MAHVGPVARVLIDSPLPQLDQLFDYAVPPELADSALPGARVSAPLRSGGRVAQGWIVERAEGSEHTGRLSELASVVSAVPPLTPEVWALARRVADRAAGNASDVLRLAIPSRHVRAERAVLAARELGAASREPVAPVAVTGYPAGRLESALAERGRVSLAARPGLAVTDAGVWIGRWAVTFAELAASTLASDRSAILIVPDHRDLQQVEAALAGVVPAAAVTRVDAAQAGSKRYRAFLEALEPSPRIVVGNRSAVYAPAQRLGLIAVWEDADPLLAEPLAPGVHARDAALIRQEQSGAALVFAGFTRSLPVQRLVELGWLTEIAPQRAERPNVIVTAGRPDDAADAHARIPRAAWNAAREALTDGPVLVQVAHPGYAASLACADCGTPGRCEQCNGPLSTNAAGGSVRCRLCGHSAAGRRCPECESTSLRPVAHGSVRTAEELGRAFPGIRVIVSDGQRSVSAVGEQPAVVVATRGAEPIAAGGYRAVLLLDGERMLLRESLDVAEDCLRWWSQAASLAAPRAPVHLVGVTGALATSLATWRFTERAAEALAARRALRFPPAVRVATVRGGSDVLAEAIDVVRAVEGTDILGPVPDDSGLERITVRVDYRTAPRLAAQLKALLIRVATRRRRPVAGRRVQAAPTLRVRFDDQELF
jgi:primosomal protein N' (replication factor Y) (superfamily II helicase)